MNKYFAFLLIILVLFGCKKAQKQQPVPHNIGTVVVEKQDLVVFPVPTPYEITDALQKTKVKFNPDLLNPVDNYPHYVTTLAKALNLGIYATDLSYANIFNDSQLTLKYFDVIKKISNDLEIIGLFSPQLWQRIEQNLNNPDSLYRITTQTYYKTYSYLFNRGKGDISAIILAGAFVEALYLSAKSLPLSQDPDFIYKKVAQQGFTIEQIMNLLQKFDKTSDYVDPVIDQLSAIYRIYRKFSYDDDKVQYNKNDVNLILKIAVQLRQSWVEMR